MRRQCMLWVGLLLFVFISGEAAAQARKTYTPQYLRAAISSIRDRARVTVTGEFDAQRGLVATTESWLRGKGFSRFTVKDPDTGFAFDSMYCKHDSEAFEGLLNVGTRRVYRFHGYKDEGEQREDAVIVESVELVRDIKPEETVKAEAKPDLRLRVTITDNASGVKTVLVNVIKGQVYRLEGLSVVVEDEPEAK